MKMAVLNASAHVSSVRRFSSTGFSAELLSNLNRRRRNFTVRCAFNLEGRRESRRRVISVALVFLRCLSLPKDAMGVGIFDKYIKRKKLDPLEAYVPAVILTEMQIKDLGKFLEVDQPKYGDCRSLLRYGPAASLRVNIRAVAQYASESGDSNSAFNDVDECLRALEELDSLLLNASRNESGASIKSMKAKIDMATEALDSLLRTVPSDVLEKGKAIADAYRDSVDETATEVTDPELKQLESIL